MVICSERDADLHMAQLMPLPLTVSCFSKIQIGFTFLVLADLGSPGKRAVKRVCVACIAVCKFYHPFLLVTTVSPTKTAEPIEMRLGADLWTVEPEEPHIRWGHMAPAGECC